MVFGKVGEDKSFKVLLKVEKGNKDRHYAFGHFLHGQMVSITEESYCCEGSLETVNIHVHE